MKRIITVILCSLICLVSLVGCESDSIESSDSRFMTLGNNTGISCGVILDKVTGVYYLYIAGKGYLGGLTPLLNPDGSPCRVDNADYDTMMEDINSNYHKWLESLNGNDTWG